MKDEENTGIALINILKCSYIENSNCRLTKVAPSTSKTSNSPKNWLLSIWVPFGACDSHIVGNFWPLLDKTPPFGFGSSKILITILRIWGQGMSYWHNLIFCNEGKVKFLSKFAKLWIAVRVFNVKFLYIVIMKIYYFDTLFRITLEWLLRIWYYSIKL